MKNTLLVLFLFLTFHSFAQQKYTISGYVKDAKTGEVLIGVIITVKELPDAGAATNAYGFYSITMPAGTYTVSAQLIGYDVKTDTVVLKQNIKHNFSIAVSENVLSAVTVTAEKKNENVTQTQMGVEKITPMEIKDIPVLFGERDILKTIQLTPGIQSAGDGNSGFYVRGGAADQNLFLLDEATVYNATHLLGFFSVFNSDAIKDVTLYKGEIPAEYGGRLSSVVDVKMMDGSDQQIHGTGGIGLIASRFTLDGPIKKNKGSFMISARRTYADLFLKLSPDTNINKTVLYFYDLNVKASYTLDDKNRVYLSGYFGKDVLGFGQTFGFNWGNATGTLRWNHLFSDKLFSNTSITFSNYNYVIQTGSGTTGLYLTSQIQDFAIKQDYEYYTGTKNEIKFGFNSTYHTIVPGRITSTDPTQTNTVDFPDKYAWDNAIYISDELKATDKIHFDYGFRFTGFSILGPGPFYTYDSQGNTLDTLNYSNGKIVKTYFNLEPRFAISYLLNEVSSVKASYGRTTQNMHLLSNSTTENPTDLWVPSDNNIKPEIADQYSLGYFRNFKENTYEFSVETYYKNLQNQIDFRDGAQVGLNENVESQLLYGVGRAYGIEFFLKKKYGRFNGWIGYTLSRVEKKIDGINDDLYYPATQDRTHDVSVVAIYELSKKWTLSATQVYYTGNAATFPSGKYEVAGQVINYYTSRNNYRMPPYSRLDLGATYIRKKTAKFESSWTFSVYNAYGRENPYVINFQTDPDNAMETEAVQTALFRWVPSISYDIKF